MTTKQYTMGLGVTVRTTKGFPDCTVRGWGLAMGILLLFLGAVVSSEAATRTWKTATTGDWFTASNWVEGAWPSYGDSVMITNAGSSVILTNSTDQLASLTLSKTLVFSNWNTTLSATTVTIQNGGIVTLPGPFADGQMSNNVYIVCSNLLVAAGGKIDVNANGYARGDAAGNGPGAGINLGSTNDWRECTGAGHGGYGGRWQAAPAYGQPYGSVTNPVEPGSGGCGYGAYPGGTGGGAVRISASGAVTVNGTITANANLPGSAYGSGGSGGSIWIDCRVFGGSNGTVSADGVSADAVNSSGGGGGGRIAVVYNSASQSSAPAVQVRFSATGGKGSRVIQWGAAGIGNPDGYSDVGTLYFPDSQLLTTNMSHSGQLVIPGFTSWAPDSLVISGWFRFPGGFNLAVSNNLTVSGSIGRLELTNSTLSVGGTVKLDVGALNFDAGGGTGLTMSVGGNVILTNAATLHLRGGIMSGLTPDWGMLMIVRGDVFITTNCVVYPWSHPTNGGSPLIRARNFTMDPGASINADYIGCARGLGTNGWGIGGGYYYGGNNGGGGGYGGRGGRYTAPYGLAYGSSNAPIYPGSGGAGAGPITAIYTAQDGGGLVRLEVANVLTMSGRITANGGTASAYGGGGSGGGIYLSMRRFAGTNGTLSAIGGRADLVNSSGGGSGGRIAVWRVYDNYQGVCGTDASGGAGSGANGNGETGTVVWGWLREPGTMLMLY